MNKKWNTRIKKGYLKIHVAVDIKTTKILSMEITADEHMHDNRMLPTLVVDDLIKSNEYIIDKFLADGAYHSNDTFRYLSENGIISCIKVRKNSKVRKTAHIFRNLSVITQQRRDLKQWKDSMVSYDGQRWMVETVFSSLKRIFGNMFILSRRKT